MIPARKLTGTNTAHNTSDMAIRAPLRLPIAFLVASYGERRSSFMMRSTFSTTTMASSTTMPMARISPSSVSMLSEKPKTSITPKVPISEMGTATIGMSVARQLWSERKTTRITSSSASKSVR